MTRTVLDEKHCSTPNCEHDHSELHLIQKCHPGTGVDAVYHKVTGLLHVKCHQCGNMIAYIKVAP